MSVNLVVAVTDSDWFNVLKQQTDLEEVNFWSPTTRNFKALSPGELFLFKLRSPHNFIVGGGIFSHADSLPCSLAWEAFGPANGARSALEMREQIAKYRSVSPTDRSDFDIGCRILTQPFFFEEADWLPAPQSWSPNTVSFKTYNTSEAEGLALWDAVNRRMARGVSSSLKEETARFGEPHLIRPRLGQGGFRTLITSIYGRRCAVTHERALPALDAAHIRPYKDGGSHDGSNGILLRRDIHKLFDAGYVTVTPDLHFEVSRRIREEFDHGSGYYSLHGQVISAPTEKWLRPDPPSLRWHNEYCYNG